MKMTRAQYFRSLILLLIFPIAAFAGNSLSVVQPTSNSLEIQLNNSEDVYGVQFSLQTSADIILSTIERGIRVSEEHWLVATYKPCDSIVNVLIISVQSKNFSAGSGTLARISFTKNNTAEASHASLSNVLITNKTADSLGVAVNNLDMSPKPAIAMNGTGSKSFALNQNFPNPFNPVTHISYNLNKAAQVRLSVYDIAGREVNRLIDQNQTTGNYQVAWNGEGRDGQKMASGMYFARLSVDNESVTQKMVMTK